jgi:hypothetical protein
MRYVRYMLKEISSNKQSKFGVLAVSLLSRVVMFELPWRTKKLYMTSTESPDPGMLCLTHAECFVVEKFEDLRWLFCEDKIDRDVVRARSS